MIQDWKQMALKYNYCLGIYNKPIAYLPEDSNYIDADIMHRIWALHRLQKAQLNTPVAS